MERPGYEFFADDNVEYVNLMMSDLAVSYSDAFETTELYKKQNDPEHKAALLKEVKDTEGFKAVEGVLGSFLGEEMIKGGSFSVERIDPEQPQVSEEQYVESNFALLDSGTELVELAGFLQEHAQSMLIEFDLCDSESEAHEKSWKAVWSRMVTTTKPAGGVVLANIADFFDTLVRYKFPDSYDPVDYHRGKEAKADTAARTFYDVFAPHLSRAIMRSGEDGWTGY